MVAPEGVIVIDAQNDSVLAVNEMAAIRTVTDKPVRFLISTHHHGDHTGGNPVYEKEGVTIISHRDCRAAMVERQMNGLPILTFDGAIELYVGGREVDVYHFGWAHTKGDAVIAIPEAGVVFSGDVLFSGKFQYTGDGNYAGWQNSLDQLKGLNASEIVPGHGPVSTNKQVDDLAAFFKETMAEVRSMKQAGKSVEDCQKSIDFKKYFDAGWGGGFFEQLPPLIVEWMYKEN
ncbi:MAG TPA: MBL fold metallo-hydrolase [Bacteroidota bacterium]